MTACFESLTECSDSIPPTRNVINSRDSESNLETLKREKDQRPDKLGPLCCTNETQTAASCYSDETQTAASC